MKHLLSIAQVGSELALTQRLNFFLLQITQVSVNVWKHWSYRSWTSVAVWQIQLLLVTLASHNQSAGWSPSKSTSRLVFWWCAWVGSQRWAEYLGVPMWETRMEFLATGFHMAPDLTVVFTWINLVMEDLCLCVSPCLPVSLAMPFK